jgi:hypothetical protein
MGRERPEGWQCFIQVHMLVNEKQPKRGSGMPGYLSSMPGLSVLPFSDAGILPETQVEPRAV